MYNLSKDNTLGFIYC